MTAVRPEKIDEIEAESLLEALHRQHGYDFRAYAPAFLMRRLQQARQRFGCSSYAQIEERLRREPELSADLVGILTIQVSAMFRDPEYYKAIREQVIPRLATWPSLKVWVAGCAGGEEIYSLAILFREEGLADRTMFYATDIDPQALRQAEAGIYPLERMAEFSVNHQRSGGRTSLSEHYTAAYGHAILDRSLRERVVFSSHSLVSDQVFSEVHLVSCRNVLIYFTNDLQNRALALFRDALVHGGFLGLGSKEGVRFTAHADCFREFCRAERIYRRASASR